MELKLYNIPTPETLKMLRETRLRMTVKEAAALVEVTVRAWQQWESGSRTIPKTVWKLVTAYFELREEKRIANQLRQQLTEAQARIKQLDSQLKSQPA